MKKRTIVTMAVIGLTVGASWADTFFTNDLTDGTSVALDFNENHGSQGNSSWTYVASGATDQNGDLNTELTGGAILDWVTADDDTARSYLATKDSSYGNYSWTAHVAFEAPAATKPYIFFGLGQGTPQESYYNEPRVGENVALKFQVGNSGSKVSVVNNGTTLENTGAWQGDPGFDFWMTYDHVNETIQFDVDNWNGGRLNGVNISTTEISTSGMFSDPNNMSIFFGSNAKATWGDFSVVAIPEPATLGTIAAFGGAMLFIRRRFMI